MEGKKPWKDLKNWQAGDVLFSVAIVAPAKVKPEKVKFVGEW